MLVAKRKDMHINSAIGGRLLPSCPYHGVDMVSTMRSIQDKKPEEKKPELTLTRPKVHVELYACPKCGYTVEARYDVVGPRRRLA